MRRPGQRRREADREVIAQWMKETEDRLSQRILDSEARTRLRVAEAEDKLRLVANPQLAGAAQVIGLDYGVDPTPRRRNTHLETIIDDGRSRYETVLRAILDHLDALTAIGEKAPEDTADAAWVNNWLPALDAAALYTFVHDRRPARYLEIGSGVSTTFARRAIHDADLAATITSIDPHPREEIDAVCDTVIRSPLEAADLSVFSAIESGDIVFFDGSHRAFTNSDVTVFFLEVLPALPPGTLVQIHDIRLPDDYPAGWEDRFYNEQYLLAALLLGGGDRYQVLLPNAFISADKSLHTILDPLWRSEPLSGAQHHGESFWLEIR